MKGPGALRNEGWLPQHLTGGGVARRPARAGLGRGIAAARRGRCRVGLRSLPHGGRGSPSGLPHGPRCRRQCRVGRHCCLGPPLPAEAGAPLWVSLRHSASGALGAGVPRALAGCRGTPNGTGVAVGQGGASARAAVPGRPKKPVPLRAAPQGGRRDPPTWGEGDPGLPGQAGKGTPSRSDALRGSPVPCAGMVRIPAEMGEGPPRRQGYGGGHTGAGAGGAPPLPSEVRSGSGAATAARCRAGASRCWLVINWQEQWVSAAARITAAGISIGRGLGASGASPEWI